MRRHLYSALALALALAAGVPAGADEKPGVAPQVADPAGDANGLNGQDLVPGLETGPSTAPASFDGADLTAVSLQTSYDTIKFRNPSGKVMYVRYDPRALVVLLRTVGSPRPSFGPTVVLRLQATAEEDDESCVVALQARIRGAQSLPTDVERAELRKVSNDCPGGAGTLTSPSFTMTFDGGLTTIQFPFKELPPNPPISVGMTLAAPRAASLGASGFGLIDESRAGAAFEIGSDVPPDVDCNDKPATADCQG